MSQEHLDAVADAHACATLETYLRSRGYLVLAPGDTSPLAQLVRAAVAMEDAWRRMGLPYPTGAGADYTHWRLEFDKAREAVSHDPTCREWVKVTSK